MYVNNQKSAEIGQKNCLIYSMSFIFIYIFDCFQTPIEI